MEKNVEKRIVNSLFEDLISEPTPLHIRALWSIKRKYTDLKYFFKKQYQRFTTGFPHEEAWSFTYFHNKFVVPRLKHLKDNLHGHPSSLNSVEEWQEILEKIIWAFEHQDDFIKPIYSDDYDPRWEVTQTPHGRQYKSMNQTGVIDWTPVREHNKKVEEGLMLFAQYYTDLWD